MSQLFDEKARKQEEQLVIRAENNDRPWATNHRNAIAAMCSYKRVAMSGSNGIFLMKSEMIFAVKNQPFSFDIKRTKARGFAGICLIQPLYGMQRKRR